MRIYGKKSALLRLEQFSASGRMPHALLITGEEGVGKGILADYAAMLMLCEKGAAAPCMTCNECLRIEQHIHPDVVYPLREMKDEKYNAKDMVEFITGCTRLPNDAQYRICIFEQAEEMNASCQNALLKFIEEPLHFNRFIFTSSDKKRILETIISRVTEIKAEPCSKDECLAALGEKGVDTIEAVRLFNTFGGNIGRCLTAHTDEGALALFRLAEEAAGAVADNHEYRCMATFASVKKRDELAEMLKNLSDIFGNAAAICVGGKPYGFFSEKSEQLAAHLTLKKINLIYETILELLRTMDFNPNVQLAAAGCCAKMFAAAEKAEK